MLSIDVVGRQQPCSSLNRPNVYGNGYAVAREVAWQQPALRPGTHLVEVVKKKKRRMMVCCVVVVTLIIIFIMIYFII